MPLQANQASASSNVKGPCAPCFYVLLNACEAEKLEVQISDCNPNPIQSSLTVSTLYHLYSTCTVPL